MRASIFKNFSSEQSGKFISISQSPLNNVYKSARMMVMVMQEKVRGFFCLQTTSTQKVYKVFQVMIKSVFIKPSINLVSSFRPTGLQTL